MRAALRLTAVLAGAVIAAASLAAAPAFAEPAIAGGTPAPGASPSSAVPAGSTAVPICPKPTADTSTCYAYRVTGPHLARPAGANGTPSGYGPSDLRNAYKLPATGVIARTVAIVMFNDDPTAEADLAVYRAQFGLPACTTANGCFQKVGQTGSTTALPAANAAAAGEWSLDMDMVSAICPACHILLVEANTNYDGDLYAAEDYATAHAQVVSNSWGRPEGSGDAANDPHFNRPGVAITFSTGDDGNGVQYPATSKYVTAVGGTSLYRASTSRGWSESAWTGAGSGCSIAIAKPSWQQVFTGCSNRAEADVSAVADPSTGVAVYQGYGGSGWSVYGGTSASSPIIAGVYALATPAVNNSYPSSFPYAHQGNLFDVATGNDGWCGWPLCTSLSGWDGPTGLGTPNGTAAFSASSPVRYKLRAVSSGLVVGVDHSSTAAGAAIIQANDDGTANQHWIFYTNPDGTFIMQNENSGLCMSTDGVTGDGLTQQPCDGRWGEVWQSNSNGNYWSYYYQRNMDVNGNSYAVGAPIDTWYVNNSTNQQFYKIAA
ncbi:hypothetical protein GCM10023322_35260 [Rugosimonospora acidiphila]|uniref:Peptidase S53 domain-containing protein n=1 Tax=Rugosimonospora acidiphila TaxID=556531 RepID=A0ABP9RW96_9ACTN